MSLALITVIGDLMLDRYWFGAAKRISPEAPIPVINIQETEDRLGGAANVALNLRSLDQSVVLAGAIGNDADGERFMALCNAHHIPTECWTNHALPTITKLRIISRQQHMLRCDFEEAGITHQTDEVYHARLLKWIEQSAIVILSDYQKGFLSDPATYIAHAKAHNIPVIIDPKGLDFTKYRGATLLTPNRSEFEAVVGICPTEEVFIAKAEALRAELDLTALLITRSEEGMTLIQADEAPFTIPAKAQDVYDVTGAGDTVIATLAAMLAKGKPLTEAAVIANIAASIVVGKLGASQVTVDELNAAITSRERAHHLVLTLDELQVELKAARANNETIVMTNGCFDILHKGHVTYLNEARQLGDRLIVALNSDRSIKALKGDNRPIMDQESRATVLASLSAVDWVIIFDEETPENLINALLPDVLVKGSDYTVDQIAGANAVLNNGGRVELLSFVDGYSTTKAIEKIKHNSK
ncbi:bifunctional D-glycero-beta-D-manno-heptose-7-phosphate kinase/D-glycero-beta-D-manno-heptose 1-phosphate adenylyltransferase HldE [Wohlfahrtiimonas chitiniclastica]|uniref:bifunctional D-glycero-beta-D-manno-heptose-7-phosphate kinase/D-glycero-beta-D-manno-heptose 1-phosphate adenylyltransferase HldE n=1 Tax=Wohlfahrtiimonas chitiniclastica TaxID=400946 RepID=UPI001BCBDF75|nr:bifunctional D-glycero-beta-D-manno-heptose-7-phosphate kinase/D-glycero-beta-D-manno-heptose 1-phosphate adenylyltransferase HldE [Wohlfahrtiimonas chitiniclastica]MBS7816923.1 bifunctional D-glycero-beta-D-manno-heptose-7-phosphate kinase/D-glycero-beta-D-manno-heptose 1-phosphate adenylyltransferase HldE [Wohlfahrtiimonas chitiniclastica]MBS7822873.1 bifunctional D-glycero-beta-D-manno-heptose-7-phosphate kinase/D-glycero-beta-D-manno-heptose 1-phosphate adenylyltransferase HldE [Wohlfahrti